jgi:hypothetical protein
LTKRRRIVVVDGSNLATEGRTEPSLRQLEEAVKAFSAEHPEYEPVVVVDATFEHRVTPKERERVAQLDRTGEIVSPPAGTVGRGDAFILQIAKRSNAIVLSNDSFQEFHVEHPWLFEDGRLVGGKPVPRVGWVFATRNPVRGQRSRTVAKKAARSTEAPAKSVEAPRKSAASPAKSTRKAPAPTKVADKSADKATDRATRKQATGQKAVQQAPRAAGAPRSTKRAAGAGKAEKAPTAAKKRGARESSTPVPATSSSAPRPEPVNTPRSFLRLVADHRLDDVVEGEVVQFTSHGAMVAVRVGKTMRVVCYAPLAGLSDPPPKRARDVLQKGATYPFRIVAFNTERRRAELALTPS